MSSNYLTLVSTGERVTIKKQGRYIITLNLIDRKKRKSADGRVITPKRIIDKKCAFSLLQGYGDFPQLSGVSQ